MKIDEGKTIAIGDYDNDISMFKAAKVGVAVSNASDKAKENADYITVSNEEDAIAKVIFDLEEGKFNL
jgi:hydroxymethylpyrimidine pyrophosphatase-like HAD family hydrolase